MPIQPEFRDVIERALRRELAARRDLRPHAQLGVPPSASPTAIEQAFSRLRGRYDAAAFEVHGPAAAALAAEIMALLRTAYESMLRPASNNVGVVPPPKSRRDETCGALVTLRGAIQRRVVEAQEHRRAGRLPDAIRVFESVLVLDRHNAVAREALRELRTEANPKRPNTFSRLFGRVFRRRAVMVAETAGG